MERASLRAAPSQSRATRQKASAGLKGWGSRSPPALRVAAKGRSPSPHPERPGGHAPPACPPRSTSDSRWELAGGAPLRFKPCCFARQEIVRRGREVSSGAAGHTHFYREDWDGGRRGEVVMETTRSPGPWGVPRPFPAEMENPGTSRAAPSGSWRTLEGDPHPKP